MASSFRLGLKLGSALKAKLTIDKAAQSPPKPKAGRPRVRVRGLPTNSVGTLCHSADSSPYPSVYSTPASACSARSTVCSAVGVVEDEPTPTPVALAADRDAQASHPPSMVGIHAFLGAVQVDERADHVQMLGE